MLGLRGLADARAGEASGPALQRLGEPSCSGRQHPSRVFSFCSRTHRSAQLGASVLASPTSVRQRACVRLSAAISVTGTATVATEPEVSGQEGDTFSIRSFLRGRRILVTGATGFLAKVLVEKILWEQPDVEQVYLLIQPRGELSAEARLREQVIPSEAYARLRERYGCQYEEFMGSKLTAVEGNIGALRLGMSEEGAAALQSCVDVVVNSAATTTFDERFDAAVAVNTLGAREVATFAAGCSGLKALVHVSTAFVNGLRRGVTPERAFGMGDTIASELENGAKAEALDVQSEVEHALSLGLGGAEARAALGLAEAAPGGAGDDAALEEALKAYGMQRANKFGWQDTYVFTKAMGEMLLGEVAAAKGLPVAIVRPSIVESSWREPVRGWMEGIRMADPIILAYGKGQMEGFVGDKDGVLDVVPCDHVINATLAAMAGHAGRPGLSVYHVATSVANPLGIQAFTEFIGEHFLQQPMLDRNGNPIPVASMCIYGTQDSFLFNMWRRYQLPIEIAEMRHKVMPWLAAGKAGSDLRKQKFVAKKTFEQLSYLASIYTPYTFYKCRFGCEATLRLSGRVDPEERADFDFDVRAIDWREYLRDVHIPGLRKYVLKGRS